MLNTWAPTGLNQAANTRKKQKTEQQGDNILKLLRVPEELHV